MHMFLRVCVCTAHFFETAAVSNFALYLCNFLLRKTVAACRQLNLPNLPPATPRPPGFTAANWQQLVAVATLFAQLPMKMFDNWRHLLYAWTIMHLHMNACLCLCLSVCRCVCANHYVWVWGCAYVCVPACVCLQSQQLPIGSKISQLQSYAPKMMINESVLVLRLFRLPLSLSAFTPLSTSSPLLLFTFTSCFQFISHAFCECRNRQLSAAKSGMCVCVKKKQTKSKSRERVREMGND